MPIKDQCQNCRFRTGDNCTRLVPSFDGTSCDIYIKRIDLEKEHLQPQIPLTESNNHKQTDTEEKSKTPSDEKIHGWLNFFLIVFVGFGSVGSVILHLVTFDPDNNFWIAAVDVVFSLIYLATGICTITAFHKRDTDAVFLAKTFIMLCFLSNLLGLFTSEGESSVSRTAASMIRSIIWCFIWFIFLYNSSQVKRLIPIGYRKTKTRDWVIIGTAILFPFICIGFEVAAEKKNHTETEAAALANLSLAPNQYSDGRIILSLPEGVHCEQSMVENIKVFSISDPQTGAEITVVSDYDNDMTQDNFNQYWNSWRDDELNKFEYDVIKDDKQSDGDMTVFYRLIRIKLDALIDWEFALAFDHRTGKVCLLSGYSSADSNSSVTHIINRLKFL